jgi:hypothetical protein
MASDRSVLERQIEHVELRPLTLDGFHRRRLRKDRNRRIASAVVALLVVGATIGGLLRAFSSHTVPADDPRGPFLGTWVNTGVDGSKQTMMIRASGDDGAEIEGHDDFATVCSGAASTMIGTGQVQGPTQLVIPSPVLTCDDGSEPEALSGPPLEDQLRNLTFVDHPETDTLTDTFGLVWERVGGDEPATPARMWPQTSLEEVRQAQELVDAGDPRYRWQRGVSWGQFGHAPKDAQLFTRFLKEVLGWEAFLGDETFAHPDGLKPGDVVYVRCAPGLTNPLYPTDSEGAGCTPTIDELRYETVKISVAQLDRQGPLGIWVVTGWEMVEPAMQADPRVVEAEDRALLEAFLQARIDGEGAEGLAEFSENDPLADERVDREIPLLYATSIGAPYERSEFELVDGPVWPDGWMQFVVRLFAENGETVVEQFFSLERDDTGRLRLVYDFEGGPAGPGPGTTDNGRAVPEEYGFLDGEVTYRAAYPLEPSMDGYRDGDRLAIDGLLLPDENAPRRVLIILADPQPIGPGCVEAPAPADAEALARSIGSDPDFEATAPVAVTIGGTSALQMDVLLAPGAGASSCPWLLLKHASFPVGADRARLYLLDLPGGSARVLAIATISDEDSFETVLDWAAPIVDSIEFHTG